MRTVKRCLWPLLYLMMAGSHAADGQACISPISYLPLDASVVGRDDNGTAALGTYERISPDGRFILRSYSGALLGKVSLMELPASGNGPVKAYQTPFSNEAFPVQGTWRYLVDVNGEHYRFKDVLARQRNAKPLFKAGMTGFYAAASELVQGPAEKALAQPAATGDSEPVRIRSLSWPQSADPDRQGVGPLQIETVRVADDGRQAHVLNSTGAQFICSERVATDGDVYALPMISVDGREFSAIPQVPARGRPTMRVYGLAPAGAGDGPSCDLRADLGMSPGKAVFGFPRDGAPAWLTYSDFGSVYVFDRQTRQTLRLANARNHVLASAFPGITMDGRVIYGATWRDCDDKATCAERAGYVVVDPYQSADYRRYWAARGQPAPKACITTAEVEHVRDLFARFQGLQDAPPAGQR
ncbi:MAG TPA: hypothetical protein PK510_00070 [Ottowia sp.]|nr:hypothetical protein [Ottowia sp.]